LVRTVHMPLPAAVSNKDATLGPMLPGAALEIAALEPTIPAVMTDAVNVGATRLTTATPTPIAVLLDAGTCCAGLSTLTKTVAPPNVVGVTPAALDPVLVVAAPPVLLMGN
jgi:hypothetical protein